MGAIALQGMGRHASDGFFSSYCGAYKLSSMVSKIDYSVVIPIFNEESIIPELWQRLAPVIKELGGYTEVIFVDDGSGDASLSLLITIARDSPNVKIIAFSRNFGHQSALSAGIDRAQGQAVILMDGDLQDPPEAILQFVSAWKQGYEVVYAIRKQRKESWLKRLAFKSFYRIHRVLSDIFVPLDAGIFSLMDRQVVLTLRKMPERNKYISGLRAYAGFKQVGVIVERGYRYHGKPRVTLLKLFKLSFDSIFAFSTIPLRVATLFGFACATFSFAIGTIALYYKLVLGREFLSWAFGLTTTFFMGGVQLIFLGIIGEYIARIYDEVKQRPYYIIKQEIGFQDEPNFRTDR